MLRRKQRYVWQHAERLPVKMARSKQQQVWERCHKQHHVRVRQHEQQYVHVQVNLDRVQEGDDVG